MAVPAANSGPLAGSGTGVPTSIGALMAMTGSVKVFGMENPKKGLPSLRKYHVAGAFDPISLRVAVEPSGLEPDQI